MAFAFMAMFFFYSRFWRFLAKIIEFKQRGQGFVLQKTQGLKSEAEEIVPTIGVCLVVNTKFF